jgi:hypothetical protein
VINAAGVELATKTRLIRRLEEAGTQAAMHLHCRTDDAFRYRIRVMEYQRHPAVYRIPS